VAESPFLLAVQPAAPAPRKCVVTGAGRGAALCGEAAHFHIEVRDQFGNRWACAAAVAWRKMHFPVPAFQAPGCRHLCSPSMGVSWDS